MVGVPEGAASLLDRAERRGMTVFHGRLEPDRAVVDAIGRRKVLAFAGIADPAKFFATLLAAGIDIADRAAFADHHRYSAAEALDLIARAKANNLMLVTTEKDLVRLTGAAPARRACGACQRIAGTACHRREGSIPATWC